VFVDSVVMFPMAASWQEMPGNHHNHGQQHTQNVTPL